VRDDFNRDKRQSIADEDALYQVIAQAQWCGEEEPVDNDPSAHQANERDEHRVRSAAHILPLMPPRSS
jgi:hypothetical protein